MSGCWALVCFRVEASIWIFSKEVVLWAQWACPEYQPLQDKSCWWRMDVHVEWRKLTTNIIYL